MNEKYSSFLTHTLPDLPASKKSSHPSTHSFASAKGLWLVNSISRAQKMQTKYNLFESDVHYNAKLNCLALAKKTQKNEVCWHELVASLDNPSSRYFWLDVQKVEQKYHASVHAYLKSISKRFNIAANLIIESRSPEFLAPLTKGGFFTAYYTRSFTPEKLSSLELAHEIELIEEALEDTPVSALSGFAEKLPFFEKYFPNFKVVTWWWSPWDRYFDTSKTRDIIAANKQVKAFLNKEGRDIK